MCACGHAYKGQRVVWTVVCDPAFPGSICSPLAGLPLREFDNGLYPAYQNDIEK